MWAKTWNNLCWLLIYARTDCAIKNGCHKLIWCNAWLIICDQLFISIIIDFILYMKNIYTQFSEWWFSPSAHCLHTIIMTFIALCIYIHRLTSIFTYQLSMCHWSVKYWLDLNIFKQILSNVTDYSTIIMYSGWELLQIDFMNIKVNE